MKRLKIFFAVLFLTACVDKDEIYQNPPEDLMNQMALILPLANDFVAKNQQEALDNGVALTSTQMELAKRVGIQHPDKIRLYYVTKLPFPEHPTLAKLAHEQGYSSPLMAAYTYGYGIWIRKQFQHDKELLAHEFIHVRQAEQLGLESQIKQYLMQLYIYGYADAPLEVEAYKEAPSYLN
ncbi:hypothetical protein [Photobacterium satsumensis]|uniref:hypothetical protein n=1 Tax=Photobacterium satsumensis TaxID=2910239 RepID=UPI003D0DB5EC